jgi:polyisoprenoid-binding protein YceI
MSTERTENTPQLVPGNWALDPNHSGVNFKVRHIGLTNVRGRFDKFNATLHAGKTLEESSVEATIDMSSVDTNQPDRDTHLRSTDFFSIDQHPEMTFRSASVQPKSGDYAMDGDLTINGITRKVDLEVEFLGVQANPMDGSTHAGFAGSTEIDRRDFGVDFNMPLGVDKFALGTKISIEIDLQFVAPATD